MNKGGWNTGKSYLDEKSTNKQDRDLLALHDQGKFEPALKVSGGNRGNLTEIQKNSEALGIWRDMAIIMDVTKCFRNGTSTNSSYWQWDLLKEARHIFKISGTFLPPQYHITDLDKGPCSSRWSGPKSGPRVPLLSTTLWVKSIRRHH